MNELAPISDVVLIESLIEGGETYAIKDSGDILKAVHPFLALRALTTNINHDELMVLDGEFGLDDTSRLNTRAKYVLISGHIVSSGAARNVVKVVLSGVVQLVLTAAFEGSQDARIAPQVRNLFTKLRRDGVNKGLFKLGENRRRGVKFDVLTLRELDHVAAR